jgi:hypothetical protein
VNQVGGANAEPVNGEVYPHALLWSGTAASVVDLNPTDLPGILGSHAFGVSGKQQVGEGLDANGNHYAMLWNGTAASAVNLSPINLTGFSDSIAIGTDVTDQIGYGYGSATGTNPNSSIGYNTHAILWSGTAASAVDLSPTNLSGFISSQGKAVSGNQEVGYGSGPATGTNSSGGYYSHALLWTGTADSTVDLNPTNLSGFISTSANGTNGVTQVGFGETSTDEPQALAWSGSAASTINLQSLLPNSYTWFHSTAYTIDSAGNIYGIANSTSGYLFAVEWSPVPEPTSFGLLSVLVTAALIHKQRARSNSLK